MNYLLIFLLIRVRPSEIIIERIVFILSKFLYIYMHHFLIFIILFIFILIIIFKLFRFYLFLQLFVGIDFFFIIIILLILQKRFTLFRHSREQGQNLWCLRLFRLPWFPTFFGVSRLPCCVCLIWIAERLIIYTSSIIIIFIIILIVFSIRLLVRIICNNFSIYSER